MKRITIVVLIVICLLVGCIGGYSAGYMAYYESKLSYESQTAALTLEVSRLNSTVLTQEKQILALKSSLSEAQAKISTLQNRLMEEQSKVLDLSSKTSTLETEVENLNADLSEAETQISTLEAEKAKLESDLAEIHNTLSNYETQISTLETQTLQAQATTSTLQSRLNRILNITVTQNYEGSYQEKPWTWDFPISLSTYVEYLERPRPRKVDAYVDMAKDPNNYIDEIVQRINGAAIKEGFTETEKVNFVIAFVQSLPYTVDNVTTPYDEYPRYPIETLFDRGGDCEDTSILAAALLDRMGYDTAILWLKDAEHVAVGVSLEGVHGWHYMYDDKKYYYLETTGEGWQIGEMPTDIIDAKAYVYPLNP